METKNNLCKLMEGNKFRMEFQSVLIIFLNKIKYIFGEFYLFSNLRICYRECELLGLLNLDSFLSGEFFGE